MEKIRRLKIAMAAFVAILRDKNHVYSDKKYSSIVATRSDYIQYRKDFDTIINDAIIQENILNEAKKLLQP